MSLQSTRLGSVAVVGGCGFLGHHIVKRLLEDDTVTSISVMSRNPNKNLFTDSRLTYASGDITPNVVINTASPVAYIDHVHAPDYERVNVGGNDNLLRAARDIGSVKAYVYTSSGPIIAGAGGAYNQADETYPTLAQQGPKAQKHGDPYHVAKARGDVLVLGANDPAGMRTATIRPTAMYGEGDQQMISNLLNVYRTKQQTVWLGDNMALMDSVYVGSVARAHLLAAHGLLAGIVDTEAPKVDGEAFNITDDTPLPPWTFFRLFWIEMGDTTPLSQVWMIPSWLTLLMAIIAEWWTWIFSFGKYRPKVLVKERIEFLLYTRTYCIKKARERLGYTPEITMAEAVRRAVGWAVKEWPEENGLIQIA
ncbi:hypothetical protein B0H67DRAFT_495605 [Lasiosphaeris hirsuta]|uniref:3-beta hydroxysteroid dehydrogenase/isomerase domain-containing protein n=1 Tax=Lasiosphaeris hirsuta TaxID=260670 RepID=A0AA40A274_9PEZI|nr:hypothetical protein B0H67DRAFT_495605 [Lasiosphaeris hirsuta]